MNIKLSDIIWAVICFVLFMLVFSGLLLKPLLKIMDERKARIGKARARSEELERERESVRLQKLAEEEAAIKKLKEENDQKLAAASAEAGAELAAFASSLKEREAEELADIERDACEAEKKLAEAEPMLIEAFTAKLIKGGES